MKRQDKYMSRQLNANFEGKKKCIHSCTHPYLRYTNQGSMTLHQMLGTF